MEASPLVRAVRSLAPPTAEGGSIRALTGFRLAPWCPFSPPPPTSVRCSSHCCVAGLWRCGHRGDAAGEWIAEGEGEECESIEWGVSRPDSCPPRAGRGDHCSRDMDTECNRWPALLYQDIGEGCRVCQGAESGPGFVDGHEEGVSTGQQEPGLHLSPLP